jgi:hypothetical protein
MEHFIKERFGWVCGRCRDTTRADGVSGGEAGSERARFFHEGEAEEREPRLSTPTLARWRDAGGRSVLFCPRCGAEEEFKTSAE